MSMELLGARDLGQFYEQPDSDRSYRQLLEGIVLILPWIATVDAFNLTGKHQQALSLSRALIAQARDLGYRPLVAELLQRRWAFNNSLTDYREPIADLEEAFSLGLATVFLNSRLASKPSSRTLRNISTSATSSSRSIRSMTEGSAASVSSVAVSATMAL